MSCGCIVLSLASAALSDPLAESPFLSASKWIEGTLLGSLANSVAVIAVATLGFLLLTGRASIRRGVTVIVGCFLLFGSAAVADGIRLALGMGADERVAPTETSGAPLPLAVVATPTPTQTQAPYDPYAGAAVPQHQ
jgi:type IV secretory pathway VirB2 component (pilin)